MIILIKKIDKKNKSLATRVIFFILNLVLLTYSKIGGGIMGGGFVELYFPNKDNDDLVVCEISNWSGECLKVSKEYFLKNKREDF